MKQRTASGRKGAGLELAMIAMAAVFLLCMLAVTVSLQHTKQIGSLHQNVTDQLMLDAMGEAFCTASAKGLDWELEDGDYRGERVSDEGEMTLRILRNEDGVCVLTVVLELVGDDYRVTQWDYA